VIPFQLLPSVQANVQHLCPQHRHFQLPETLQKQFVELYKKHNYKGKNISTLKQSWEKTYGEEGESLDVGKYGFRNFLAAFKTIPYFRLEREAPLLHPVVTIYSLQEEEKDDGDAGLIVCANDKAESDSDRKNGVVHMVAETTNTGQSFTSRKANVNAESEAEKKSTVVVRVQAKDAKNKEKLKQPKGSLTYVAYLR